MNIYDISKAAGVSIATVSRVINGSASVSEKTRERVLKAIDEAGYTPNVFARGLGLNSMKTIGILCADVSDPYLAQAVYYVEQDLTKNNYASILCCTGYDLQTKERCMGLLINKRVDGIVIIGSNYVEQNDDDNAYIKQAAKSVPIMLLNGLLSFPGIYCTLCDDYASIYDLTQRFIDSGRKNLLYLYNSHSYSGRRKLSAFRDCVKDNGLIIKDDHIRFLKQHSISVSQNKEFLYELDNKSLTFDGVITAEDIIAVAVIKYAKEKGLRIPEDIFVSGYNNSNFSECCDPEITSVDNKLELLCHSCVATLMSVFSDDKSAPSRTIFSSELVERGSTKLNPVIR